MKIPKSIDLNREAQYCLNCFATNVKRTFLNGLTYYECLSCGNRIERSLVIDNKIVWWVDKNDVYWHESVGVVVVVKDKILTLLRQIFPFSYTIPAGHLDKGESPEDAAKRELEEETGIELHDIELLEKQFEIHGDSCRRGSDHHLWHLYRAKLNSYPKIRMSDEACNIKWMTLEEIEKEPQLIYPLKIFVGKFGIDLLK